MAKNKQGKRLAPGSLWERFDTDGDGTITDEEISRGKEMLELALERCFADARVNAVLIDPMASNTRARHFYGKLGFCLVEYRCFTKVECAVYRLERNVWMNRS